MTQYSGCLCEVYATGFTSPTAEVCKKGLVVLRQGEKRSKLRERVGHAIPDDVSTSFGYPEMIGPINAFQILVPRERIEKKPFPLQFALG